jgi:hypothetical protein
MRLFAKRAATALVTGTLIAILANCQLLVTTELPAFTCTGTDLSACPKGQYCKGAGCAPCETVDVCDGYDNDCNGKVDDGPAADRDEDGFSACGRRGADGTLVDVDCDDADPTVYPGAKETCNGKDDDCDRVVDNPGVACPQGETCAPKTGKCIRDDMLCNPTNCPMPKYCDPATQACIDPTTTVGLGEACESDKQCRDMEAFCALREVMRGKLPVASGVCTRACCSSADCPPGLVCFAPGTGGKYCVKSQDVGVTATGTKPAGATAAADSECRSGRISNGKCVDVCCSSATCTNGTVCRNTSIFDTNTYACLDPVGTRNPGESCDSNNRCKEGICSNGVCRSACCQSQPCGMTSYYLNILCGEVQAGGGGAVPACAYLGNNLVNGGKVVGATCSKANDCRGEFCFTATSGNYCSDVCCTDADCGGLKCRPRDIGNGFFGLRCTQP